MKHEKLMRAMGEIDEDLILEAHEERRAKTIWIRFAASAACFALLVLIAPRAVKIAEDSFGAGEAEMDAELPQTSDRYNGTLDDLLDENENAEIANPMENGTPGDENAKGDTVTEQDAATSTLAALQEALKNCEIDNEALLEQLEKLDEKDGGYPLDAVIENEYGTVTFTDRTATTVTMQVTLLSDMELSVYSVTSGTWTLCVNGEATETFPDKAGTYEILIDFSGDPNLNMIFVGKFGVFSIDVE